ncbi:HNH endonuclease signature motif containing protein [Pseudomonas syringae pv. syringae]|uniref:HNH endonuclease n=1 Tax=Pseudomonas syringae TaxID=317 RepID=UPI002E7BB470|nr:HNH endonuclease signature motif containing protein [Pseudomonas syringae]MEE1994021.1 HNH endonuclease signature motif containing protein [Pseudomonas syringae pv. syringae]MEE1999193.1 HNH endonuclease signature motif containing protein [Pseudomonas syringae pv. syringae]
MKRNRNVGGLVIGGPSNDLVSAVERLVYRRPIDENERVEFEFFDLKQVALESVDISENTALHKVLGDIAYTNFYIYLYDDLDWVGEYSDFVNYVVEMFGHMQLVVPREFYRKTDEGIIDARDKYRQYFIGGLRVVVDSAFAQLWTRKQFLFDFNMRLAEEISPLLKSEYPILGKDGQLPRATYFPVWVDNLVIHRERGLCHYCGLPAALASLPNQTYDIDHMVPIAGGGTNDATNLVLSCPVCNNKKRASHQVVPDTFAWPTRS